MAIALSQARSFAFADGFFVSPGFRAAVIEDRPLVLALADYIGAAVDDGRLTAQVAGVLAIERAQAEARRDAGVPAPGLSLAPGVRLLATDSAAMAALHAAERHLFELSLIPHMALCDDRPALELPVVTARPLYLAVRASGGEVALGEVPEPLFRSLSALAARAPLDRGQVPSVLAAVRLRVADTDRLIDDLVADGYMVEAS